MKDSFGNDLKVGDRVVARHIPDYDDFRLMYGTVTQVVNHKYSSSVEVTGWAPEWDGDPVQAVTEYDSPEYVIKVGEKDSVWMFPEHKFSGNSEE